MRELTFKRDGLLTRLAVVYGPMKEWDTETNICTFWWSVFAGFWWALMITGISGLVIGGILGDTLGWIFAMIHMGYMITPDNGAVVFLFILFVISMLALVILIRWLFSVHGPTDENPSFLKEAYKSWKEKTCVRVLLK
jgi:hypothetical protein